MTRQHSSTWHDLGYPPRSTPRAQRPAPSAQRPVPSLDPDLIDAPAENDFTRWYDQQCREKNRPNKLRRTP